MRKKIHSILFALIISLSFLGIASADTRSSIEITFAASKGAGERNFLSTSSVRGLTCEGEKIEYNVTKSIKSGISMRIVAGQYKMIIPAGIEETDVVINCQYEFADSSLTKDGTSTEGDLKINLHLMDMNKNHEYEFNLNAYSRTQKRVTGPSTPFTNVDVDRCDVTEGADYITCDRGSNGYLINVRKDATFKINTHAQAKLTLKNGSYILINVTIEPGVFIFANYGAAKCDGWNSSWEGVPAELIDKLKNTNADSVKISRYPILEENGLNKILSLPNCEYSGAAGAGIYEFKGWYFHNNPSTTTADTETCDTNPLFNGSINLDEEFKEDLQTYKFLVTCFKKNNNVVTVDTGNYGTISDANFSEIPDSRFKGVYRAVLKGETAEGVALPKVSFHDTDLVKHDNYCWLTEDKSKCLQPGTIAPVGQYSLYMETSGVIAGDVYGGNKEIEVGVTKSQVLVSQYIDAGTITSCSSANTAYVKTEYSEDKKECKVSGVKEISSYSIVVTVKGKKDGKNVTVKYKFRVTNAEQSSNEGQVLSATDGNTFTDLVGFVETSQEVQNNCDNYKISRDPNHSRDKGTVIIDKFYINNPDNDTDKYAPISESIYSGTATCSGKEIKIAAVCMDPGRNEPNKGVEYRWDHNTNPKNSLTDKLSAVLYQNSKYSAAIDRVAAKAGGSEEIAAEDLKTMAAATLAYRLLTIKERDGAAPTGELSDDYNAYWGIAKNINTHIGATWQSTEKNKGITALRAIINETDSNKKAQKVKNLYCVYKENGKSVDHCKGSSVNVSILNLATKMLYDALSYKVNNAKTIKVNAYVVETTTKPEADGSYTKTIKGVFSGIPATEGIGKDHFLSVRPTCENCGKYGINVTFEVGRDYDHMVVFDETANILIAKYPNGPYSGKPLFNEESGEMVFKYTIRGNINDIARASGTVSNATSSSGKSGPAHKGNPSQKTVSQFSIKTSVGIDGKSYELNTGQADPAKTANFQRMAVFNDISATKRETDGEYHVCNAGPCGFGNNNSFDISASPSVDIEYKNTGRDKNMIINFTSYDSGTFLPSCDTSVPAYDYTRCKSAEYCNADFNPSLFVGAGCCSMILDENNYVYSKYCNNTCTQSTYTPICKEQTTENGLNDSLAIHEGVEPDGEVNYTCVYNNDISKTAENIKRDARGNAYNISIYNENNICRVYCKEDWDFTVPNSKNFVGSNAVVAGQYFVLRTENVNTSGKRTCVTSRIDIEKWSKEIFDLSVAEVKSFAADNFYDFFEGVKSSALSLSSTAGKKSCGAGVTFAKKYDSNGDFDGYNTSKCSDGNAPKQCYNVKASYDLDFTYPTFVQSSVTPNVKGEVGSTTFNYYYVDGHGLNDNNVSSTDGSGDCNTINYDTKEKYIAKYGQEIENAALAAFHNQLGGWSDTDYHSYKTQINKKIEEMQLCQYWDFALRNTQGYTSSTKAKNLISTGFDPQISYEYDEAEFMQKLASMGANVLERQKSTYTRGFAYYSDTDFNVKTYEGTIIGSKEFTGESGDVLTSADAAAGLVSTYEDDQHYASCYESGSGQGKEGASKSGREGKSYSWDREAGCSRNNADYLKDAYYIKRYIGAANNYKISSSRWYIDTILGYREFADSAANAAKASSSPNKEASKWKVYGDSSRDNIVFPIGEKTQRNLYQYSITFYNLGNYNNEAKLGRIMGNNNSVVGNNSRVCFYEVVEGLCYCCGDTLETELVAPAGQTTRSILNQETNSTNRNLVCPDKQKTCEGDIGSYEMSKSLTDALIDENSGASIEGLTINNVSLNTATEDAGRILGANWSEEQHYVLDGYVYVTDKGANLLKNIEDEGERVYNKAPEYSYTLSPTALNEIRQNNNTNGYQEKSSSMIQVGYSKLKSNKHNEWTAGTDEPGIVHFASTFLNDFANKYVTEEYSETVLSKLGTNANVVCYVYSSGDSNSYQKNGFQYGASGNVYKADGSHAAEHECRWIDYVGTVKRASDDTGEHAGAYDKEDAAEMFYRLSFK